MRRALLSFCRVMSNLLIGVGPTNERTPRVIADRNCGELPVDVLRSARRKELGFMIGFPALPSPRMFVIQLKKGKKKRSGSFI